MSKTQTERIGVNALREYIDESESLRSYVDDNDKTPMWDGSIFVYEGEPDINEHLIGKVDTQIKTTEVGRFSTSVKYYLEKKVAQTYKTQGVVFVVVEILKVGRDYRKKIFYNCLTPMSLKGLLDRQAGHKTLRVDMLTIPDDSRVFTQELKEFIEHCRKQSSYVDKPTLTIDKAIEIGKRTVLSTSFIGNTNNFHEEITSRPLWFYKQTEYADIPIGDEPLFIETESLVHKPVSIKEKIYYHSYYQKSNYDFNVFKIGESITAILPTEKNVKERRDRVELKVTGKGTPLLYDLDFYLEVLKNLEMSIGERTIALSDEIFRSGKFKETLSIAARHFARFHNCVETAKKLHIPFDLDFTGLGNEEIENSLALCEKITGGATVSDSDFTSKIDFPYKSIWICDAFVLLAFCDRGDGRFTIHDGFNPPFTLGFADGEIQLPTFTWVMEKCKNRLVDNIDVERVKNEYSSFVQQSIAKPESKSQDGTPINEYIPKLLSLDISRLNTFLATDPHPEKKTIITELIDYLTSLLTNK